MYVLEIRTDDYIYKQKAIPPEKNQENASHMINVEHQPVQFF